MEPSEKGAVKSVWINPKTRSRSSSPVKQFYEGFNDRNGSETGDRLGFPKLEII